MRRAYRAVFLLHGLRSCSREFSLKGKQEVAAHSACNAAERLGSFRDRIGGDILWGKMVLLTWQSWSRTCGT
jgi:hypothetical protein